MTTPDTPLAQSSPRLEIASRVLAAMISSARGLNMMFNRDEEIRRRMCGEALQVADALLEQERDETSSPAETQGRGGKS